MSFKNRINLMRFVSRRVMIQLAGESSKFNQYSSGWRVDNEAEVRPADGMSV